MNPYPPPRHGMHWTSPKRMNPYPPPRHGMSLHSDHLFPSLSTIHSLPTTEDLFKFVHLRTPPPVLISGGWLLKHIRLVGGRYAFYWNAFLYRLQCSCSNVKFPQVSVILFTGVVCLVDTPPPPGRHHPLDRDHPLGQTPPPGQTPPTQCMLGRYTRPPGGHCSGRYTSYWF